MDKHLLNKARELEKIIKKMIGVDDKERKLLKNLEKNLDVKKLKKLIDSYHKLLLEIVFECKILTKEEYERDYRNKYIDEWGFDSFLHYLDAVINSYKRREDTIFTTINKKMLSDRSFLEEKFGVRILSPKEIMEGRKIEYFVGE